MMDCFDRLINYNATFNIMIKRCLVFSRLKGETKKYFIFFISLEFFPSVCNIQQRIIALHLWQFLSVVEIFILRPFGVCCTVQSNESRHETAVDYRRDEGQPFCCLFYQFLYLFCFIRQFHTGIYRILQFFIGHHTICLHHFFTPISTLWSLLFSRTFVCLILTF